MDAVPAIHTSLIAQPEANNPLLFELRTVSGSSLSILLMDVEKKRQSACDRRDSGGEPSLVKKQRYSVSFLLTGGLAAPFFRSSGSREVEKNMFTVFLVDSQNSMHRRRKERDEIPHEVHP